MKKRHSATLMKRGNFMVRESPVFTYGRLPKQLQHTLGPMPHMEAPPGDFLELDRVYSGDARDMLPRIRPNSVSLSVWSPPYFVGKQYESHLSFDGWKTLLSEVIRLHLPIIKPGGFLAVNIADILCFKDPSLPRIQADTVSRRKIQIAREDILQVLKKQPGLNRYQLAKFLGCSEQTVDRRLHGNNIRGGKYATQTRVKIVGGLLEEWAIAAGFAPYDRRIWAKDACWENSRWSSLSYRSVDEFEYIYMFWKPGLLKVDRARLSPKEWRDWGSRGVWSFPSVRANDDHEAKFPIELPLRVIRLLTDPGETVLDCFMGSGTTAIAAMRTDRSFIGIEIMPKYTELACRNIHRERAQGVRLVS